MDKTTLQTAVVEAYQAFSHDIAALSAEAYLQPLGAGKWSPAQVLDHLCRATAPVALGFGLPRLVPLLLFGKSRRPSRTYDDLVAAYQHRLAQGAKASPLFVPPAATLAQRTRLIAQLERNSRAIARQLARLPEADLDVYLLPHPILGKLTLREMAYFTIYHAYHHRLRR